MPRLRKPGVQFDWIPAPPPAPPDPKRLDIAGFVGVAARGPLDTPVRLRAWSDFCAVFGAQTTQAWLAHAVNGFFANGGQACWVVRVADPSLAEPASLPIVSSDGAGLLMTLVAATPGTWGRGVRASLTFRSLGRFDLSLALDGETKETWLGLSLDATPDAAAVINLNSRLVNAVRGPASAGAEFGFLSGADRPGERAAERMGWSNARDALLEGGSDGLAPQADLTLGDGVKLRFLQIVPVRTRVDYDAETLTIFADGVQELSLPVTPGQPELLAGAINDPLTGSRLVRVEALPCAPSEVSSGPVSVTLSGGLTLEMMLGFKAGDAPPLDGAATGLLALEAIKEVGAVAAPDLMPNGLWKDDLATSDASERLTVGPVPFTAAGIAAAQSALLDRCRRKGDRFAILDSPFDGSERRSAFSEDAGPDRDAIGDRSRTELEDLFAWVQDLPDSGRDFGALYFPWLSVANPAGLDFPALCAPPCGHIAGAYARCDVAFGLRRSPANLALEAALDTAVRVGDGVFGDLNILGVNVLRAEPGRGVRIGGARTLAPHTSPAVQAMTLGDDDGGGVPSLLGGGAAGVRYVSERRLLLMLVRLLERELQWTVFEPSDRRLWGDIERVVRSQLRQLWRDGALDGASEAQAFFVRCDDSTNPPEQIENGMVVCLLGLRLPSPAEFILVRIGKTEALTRLLD